MIITRRFVFIHFPKTAGIWATKAIKQAHIELFIHKTPLGEILASIAKWLPFMAPKINRLINRMVEFNYKDYELGELSVRNYHDPRGRRIYEWLLILGEAIFLFDKHYETLLRLRRHTRYAQIPQEFQTLPLVSSMRDPFSWHVSRYLYYKNWQTKAGAEESAEFIKLWGELNNFGDYCNSAMMIMQNAFYQGYRNYLDLNGGQDKSQYHDELISFYKPEADKYPKANHYGLMSLRFIQMYFKQPQKVLGLSPKEFKQYWSSGEYKKDLPKIVFLEQSKISKQLPKYMLKMKYPEEVLGGIATIPPKNTSSQYAPNTSQAVIKSLKEYYSKKNIRLIYKLEKPIFDAFPQYEDLYKQLLAE